MNAFACSSSSTHTAEMKRTVLSYMSTLADHSPRTGYQQNWLLQLCPGWHVIIFWTDCSPCWMPSPGWSSEHISPLLCELHWLWVLERIQFRLCVLAFRCLHGTAQSYLVPPMSTVVVTSAWPTLVATFSDCDFPVAAARARTIYHWWSLIRASSLLVTFCRQLKTYLFQSTFHWLTA